MNERLFRLTALIRKGGVTRLKDLARELEVTRKTVQMDINHLRSLDHKIEYSRSTGWRYLEPPPDLALSPDELFALLVAQKAMAAYRGTPLEAPLQQVFQKFSGDEAKIYCCSWEFLGKAITIKTSGLSGNDIDVYRRVVLGISMRREIRFQYRGLKDKSPRRRRVRPYHLCCWSNAWYLVGYDYERDEMRTFALPRVSTVEVLETIFPAPDLGVIQAAIADGFGIFFESKPEQVEVWFASEIARWIQERTWHNSQSFEFLDGGHGLLRMEVGITPEFEQWILSFGEQAAILSPEKLRLKMAARHEAASALYKSNSSNQRVA